MARSRTDRKFQCDFDAALDQTTLSASSFAPKTGPVPNPAAPTKDANTTATTVDAKTVGPRVVSVRLSAQPDAKTTVHTGPSSAAHNATCTMHEKMGIETSKTTQKKFTDDPWAAPSTAEEGGWEGAGAP